jgi:hypothetical protein
MYAAFLGICFAGCKPSAPHYFTIAQSDVYDKPTKTKFTERLLLTKSLTKAELVALLKQQYNEADSAGYSYHKSPTHIFIYVYDVKTNDANLSDNWIGMVSKDDNQYRGIELKIVTNPSDPITTIEKIQ